MTEEEKKTLIDAVNCKYPHQNLTEIYYNIGRALPFTAQRFPSESYDAAFLKRNEIKTRQCVYISREIHKRISRIVSVLAKHELTVGGYIDLILERHLEENQEEINGLLRKEIDDWNV